MSQLLRLACGTGRSAVARQLLVAAGIALGTVLVLLATGVATLGQSVFAEAGSRSVSCVTPEQCTTVITPGSNGPITLAYLREPGLRQGVVLGFVLCLVPVLVFVATASRVAARRRDQRFAALRLAGASPSQARRLALVDALVGGVVGVVAGIVLYLVARQVVMATLEGQPAVIARETTPPLALGAAVLLVLLLALAASSVLTLRRVQIGPLAVHRRAARSRPRPWALGLAVPAAVLPLAWPGPVTGSAGMPWLVLPLVTVMLGLALSASWLVATAGRLAADGSPRPAVLLAGRQLQEDPGAHGRALSAVLLLVFVVTVGLWPLQEMLQSRGVNAYDDRFREQGFAMAAVGAVISLVVAAAGLLLTTTESMLERRRTLAALHASGVALPVLRRSLLTQSCGPVLPAALLAVLCGLSVGRGIFEGATAAGPVVALALCLPFVAAGATALMTTLTFPLLRGVVDLEQLRTP